MIVSSSKQENEGVVKYVCNFKQQGLPPIIFKAVEELSKWRQILYHNHLIGQDPLRYGGFGFGNLSIRLANSSGSFLITSTQTSGLPDLGPNQHYTVIQGYDLDANSLSAYGPTKPSSEALTHAAIYDFNVQVQAVFHAHSPAIWGSTKKLKIPATKRHVEYGTPQMAYEMQRLLKEGDTKAKRIISMLGHQDGIVTFGQTLDQAGENMLNYLQRASALKV